MSAGQETMGSPHGGGEQGEPVEGSLTNGGALPGSRNAQDRSFGAGRRSTSDADLAGVMDMRATGGRDAAASFEGLGEDPGVVEDSADAAAAGAAQGPDRAAGAGPGGEEGGQGDTAPR